LTHLRWQWQPNSGQATARNTGVNLAQAPIVVFLDDDVVPEPDLLAVHLNWHKQLAPLAVLGDYQVAREQCDSLYHLGVWAWWEDLFYQRSLPEHQSSYRDFCTGNVSLRREDFERVGGFDTAFRGYGGEDYELGYRLLRAGVRFVVDRNARARHYHRTTVAGVLRATRQEAHGDFLLGRKHPELRAGLRLMWTPAGRYGLLVRLALRAPAVGDRLMSLLQYMLPFFERTQMRRRWLLWFNHLRGYAYWRGVRDVLGSWDALLAYQAEAAPLPRASLDISDGLPGELPPLWVDGPMMLTVTWREQRLGKLYLPGSIESPLRSFLASRIAEQLERQIWIVLGQAEHLPWDSRRLPADPAVPHSGHADGHKGAMA
jgi:glycosyltransferase involved in cell wall biosynthesis